MGAVGIRLSFESLESGATESRVDGEPKVKIGPAQKLIGLHSS